MTDPTAPPCTPLPSPSFRPLNLSLHLRHLQNQHRQLQQSLAERSDSLQLHVSLPELSPITPMLQQMVQKRQEVQSSFSGQLLRNQVQMQLESEMGELIKNYEKRIVDLRVSLINKEAEITFSAMQRKRETVLRRDSLQALTKEDSEKTAVRKQLQEMKKLKVEISAMEDAVRNALKVKVDSKQQSKQESKQQRDENMVKLTRIEAYAKQKCVNLQKDALVNKVFRLLEEETERQNQQLAEIDRLSKELNTLTNSNKQLCRKYRKLQKERHTPTNLSTILEAPSITSHSTLPHLLSEIDPNVDRPSTDKPMRTTLKQRRRHTKEN